MKINNKKIFIATIVLISISGFFIFSYIYIKSTTLKNISNFNNKSIYLNSYYSIVNTSSKEYKVIKNDTSEIVIPEYIDSYKIIDHTIYLKQTAKNSIQISYWIISNDKITGPIDSNTFLSTYNIDSNTFEDIIN